MMPGLAALCGCFGEKLARSQPSLTATAPRLMAAGPKLTADEGEAACVEPRQKHQKCSSSSHTAPSTESILNGSLPSAQSTGLHSNRTAAGAMPVPNTTHAQPVVGGHEAVVSAVSLLQELLSLTSGGVKVQASSAMALLCTRLNVHWASLTAVAPDGQCFQCAGSAFTQECSNPTSMLPLRPSASCSTVSGGLARPTSLNKGALCAPIEFGASHAISVAGPISSIETVIMTRSTLMLSASTNARSKRSSCKAEAHLPTDWQQLHRERSLCCFLCLPILDNTDSSRLIGTLSLGSTQAGLDWHSHWWMPSMQLITGWAGSALSQLRIAARCAFFERLHASTELDHLAATLVYGLPPILSDGNDHDSTLPEVRLALVSSHLSHLQVFASPAPLPMPSQVAACGLRLPATPSFGNDRSSGTLARSAGSSSSAVPNPDRGSGGAPLVIGTSGSLSLSTRMLDTLLLREAFAEGSEETSSGACCITPQMGNAPPTACGRTRRKRASSCGALSARAAVVPAHATASTAAPAVRAVMAVPADPPALSQALGPVERVRLPALNTLALNALEAGEPLVIKDALVQLWRAAVAMVAARGSDTAGPNASGCGALDLALPDRQIGSGTLIVLPLVYKSRALGCLYVLGHSDIYAGLPKQTWLELSALLSRSLFHLLVGSVRAEWYAALLEDTIATSKAALTGTNAVESLHSSDIVSGQLALASLRDVRLAAAALRGGSPPQQHLSCEGPAALCGSAGSPQALQEAAAISAQSTVHKTVPAPHSAPPVTMPAELAKPAGSAGSVGQQVLSAGQQSVSEPLVTGLPYNLMEEDLQRADKVQLHGRSSDGYRGKHHLHGLTYPSVVAARSLPLMKLVEVPVADSGGPDFRGRLPTTMDVLTANSNIVLQPAIASLAAVAGAHTGGTSRSASGANNSNGGFTAVGGSSFSSVGGGSSSGSGPAGEATRDLQLWPELVDIIAEIHRTPHMALYQAIYRGQLVVAKVFHNQEVHTAITAGSAAGSAGSTASGWELESHLPVLSRLLNARHPNLVNTIMVFPQAYEVIINCASKHEVFLTGVLPHREPARRCVALVSELCTGAETLRDVIAQGRLHTRGGSNPHDTAGSGDGTVPRTHRAEDVYLPQLYEYKSGLACHRQSGSTCGPREGAQAGARQGIGGVGGVTPAGTLPGKTATQSQKLQPQMKLIRSILIQLALAVQHLHSVGLLHGEIRAENVLCMPAAVTGVVQQQHLGIASAATAPSAAPGVPPTSLQSHIHVRTSPSCAAPSASAGGSGGSSATSVGAAAVPAPDIKLPLTATGGELKATMAVADTAALSAAALEGAGTLRVKLKDAGLCCIAVHKGQLVVRKLLGRQRTARVTLLAPELFRGERPTRATDMWAFGMLMYQMLTGQAAFRTWPDTSARLVHAVVHDGLRPIFPANTEAWYVDLANRCWSASPKARPSTRRLLATLRTGALMVAGGSADAGGPGSGTVDSNSSQLMAGLGFHGPTSGGGINSHDTE